MKGTLVALVLLGSSSVAFAQTKVLVETFDPSALPSRSPSDFAEARPFPLPRVSAQLDQLVASPQDLTAARDEPDLSTDRSQPPTVRATDRRGLRRTLFEAPSARTRISEAPGTDPSRTSQPKTYGSGGLDFTSSRLIPSTVVTAYPYSAVGKLYFSDQQDDYVCSGAVIATRLVITAAHCVHGGPSVGFYQNLQFAPAYRDGVAPFGLWDVDAAFVPTSWAASGEVPHQQDWAILQIADQDGLTVGGVVGTLTYGVNRLADNHLHLLGYPGNLDDGEQMHQVASSDYVGFDEGTVVYGSDMGEGSSGGPWVQNFNRPSRGQHGGLYRKRLAVVGVTSYGFDDPRIMAQGASVLTEDFLALRETACANQNGNC